MQIACGHNIWALALVIECKYGRVFHEKHAPRSNQGRGLDNTTYSNLRYKNCHQHGITIEDTVSR